MSALVRLGIRVRADRAELALAELLPLLGAGAEQRDMLEKFAATLTADNERADEGMIAKLKRVLAG